MIELPIFVAYLVKYVGLYIYKMLFNWAYWFWKVKFHFQNLSILFLNLNLFILIGGWLLYNIVLVLPYINMNLPRVYTCSQSRTPLPPLFPYHPSGSSQYTSPKHPVSCIEPRLAIRFLCGIIHVSMPFSQIIPTSPSPTESKRLFYTSVSLLLSRIQGYRYIFLNSIHMH